MMRGRGAERHILFDKSGELEAVNLDDYTREHWWGNDEIPTAVHRLTHPDRPTLFEKTAPTLRSEYERMLWCQGRLPVPEVVAFESTADGDRLVTTAIDGVPAHDRISLPDEAIAARALAEAWQHVHHLDPASCPFDTTTASLLADVEVRLASGTDVLVWDADHGAHRAPADVYEELVSDQPPPDLVVIHGDASVPNVLVRDSHAVGIVDVGMLGVGDRWWSGSCSTCQADLLAPRKYAPAAGASARRVVTGGAPR